MGWETIKDALIVCFGSGWLLQYAYKRWRNRRTDATHAADEQRKAGDYSFEQMQRILNEERAHSARMLEEKDHQLEEEQKVSDRLRRRVTKFEELLNEAKERLAESIVEVIKLRSEAQRWRSNTGS